jgi:hypothetical protein
MKSKKIAKPSLAIILCAAMLTLAACGSSGGGRNYQPAAATAAPAATEYRTEAQTAKATTTAAATYATKTAATTYATTTAATTAARRQFVPADCTDATINQMETYGDWIIMLEKLSTDYKKIMRANESYFNPLTYGEDFEEIVYRYDNYVEVLKYEWTDILGEQLGSSENDGIGVSKSEYIQAMIELRDEAQWEIDNLVMGNEIFGELVDGLVDYYLND